MRFDAAWILLLLALLPPAAAALRRLDARRRADLAAVGELPLLRRLSTLPDVRRRSARRRLALGALALMMLALAGPQFGAEGRQISRDRGDVLFLLDLSRSMEARDAAPSRLEASRRAIAEIVDALPDDRFGLVVFAGTAFLQLPPTMDRVAFAGALRQMDPAAMPDPGTDLPQALATAATAFARGGAPPHRALVVLSDGESLEGDLDAAIAAFQRTGIRAFALGVGSPAGVPLPDRPGRAGPRPPWERGGPALVTRLEEAGLRLLARRTGGSYVRLDEVEGVPRTVAALRRLERREVAAQADARLPQRYQWPLALALGLLVAEGMLLDRRSGTPATKRAGALVAAVVAGASGAATQQPEDGQEFYRAGRFQEAHAAFLRLAAREREEGREDRIPALAFNGGNALYRLARYDEALRSFHGALAGTPRIRQRSRYNSGNALFRLAENALDRPAELRRAIAAYEEALLIDPADIDAKWNLELSVRELEDAERWRGMPMHREGPGASAGRSENEQGAATAGLAAPAAGGGGVSGEGRGSERLEPVRPMTSTEARRLVRSVRAEEERRRPAADEPAAGGPNKKDW